VDIELCTLNVYAAFYCVGHACGSRTEQPVGACRFVFCKWHGMVPLRYCPVSEWVISAWIQRYASAADLKVTGRDMRAGMALTHMVQANAAGEHHITNELSIIGQWCPSGKTAETTYLHQGYYNAAMAHRVCSISPTVWGA